VSHSILFYWILSVSLIAFVLFGADKEKAAGKRRRIPEKTLFLSAWLGGAPGALLGMLVFRHKTRHKRFLLGIPGILLLWAAVILLAHLKGWIV